MHRLVALALILASPAVLACPAQSWSTAPAMPDNTVIADDGGVVMTMTSDRRDGGGALSLHLRSGGKPVEINLVWLAGGMSMLVPKTPGKRTLELVDSTGKVVRTYAQEPGGTRLPAPGGKVASTLSAATMKKWGTNGPSYGIPSGQMSITLDADPPADALGLIVYDAETKQGLSFGKPMNRQIAFYQGGKGCSGPSNAVAMSGKRVVLGWIDVHGRASALSKPITVGVMKP